MGSPLQQNGLCRVVRWIQREGKPLESNEIAHAIVNVAADKKATDIVLLELRQVSLIADYFVLCDGQSSRQLWAISNAIAESLKELGERPLRVEGTPR